MRVLQINAVNQYGSTGRTCAEMSKYLWEHGHECYTAFSVGSEDCHSKCVSSVLECKLHALLSRITGLQGYFSPISTTHIINYIRNLRPDIVILRNLHANFVNQKMLFKYLADNDIPTILALDDCWFYTGGCTHYTIQGCDRWKVGCGNCPNRKKEGTNWFFDRSFRVCRDRKKWYKSISRLGVAGVSNWIINEAKKAYVFDETEIFRCTYNWINTELFAPKNTDELRKTLNAERKKIILGVASTWNEKKGFSDFIRLSHRLGNDYLIILVGKMKEYTGSHPNMLFVGETESIVDLISYYNVANVFVTFSLEESFGKVSAEALSCGTPVVCYDSTANSELVGEGCGQVVPVGEFELMVKAIKNIAGIEKKCFQKYCRDFAVQNFGEAICINKYIDMINKLISSTRIYNMNKETL